MFFGLGFLITVEVRVRTNLGIKIFIRAIARLEVPQKLKDSTFFFCHKKIVTRQSYIRKAKTRFGTQM